MKVRVCVRAPAMACEAVPRKAFGSVIVAAALLGAGCETDLRGELPPGDVPSSGGTAPGSGGTSSGMGGTSGSSTGGGPGGGSGPGACQGSEIVASKRLIRLTFNQQVNSIRALFGDAIAARVVADFDLPEPTERTFPPLANTREGSVVTDTVWQMSDNVAKAVGEYVLENFATVTTCGAAPTDDCAEQALANLGGKAYRRKLSSEESARLVSVYTQAKAAGGTVQEAFQHGVYAVLESPHFLYRTEFGAEGSGVEGKLGPYEMASMLSYFITDGPPDDLLLGAAESGALADAALLRGQVERLLATPAARLNLQQAMFAYFAIPALDSVIIDPARAPDFDDGIRNSMYRESELFINDTLWNGKLADLLTSRRSFINDRLAALYGVSDFPGAAVPDAQGFAPVTFAANRAGIMTMGGFLTARARTDVPSVVGRGLLINQVVLCGENPAFPEERTGEIDEISAMQTTMSEREKAEYRAASDDCGGCHSSFDAYGLALEPYDIIGKFRTMDEAGRPIDPRVTLPDNAWAYSDFDGDGKREPAADLNGDGVLEPGTDTSGDGRPDVVVVPDALAMASQIAVSGAFATCMARHLVAYALAEGGTTTSHCGTQAVAGRFGGLPSAERTFSAMVREVALSNAVALRSAGR
jgi:hypothetical protein